MIPEKQLTRKGEWGTLHKLFCDKSCTLSARLSRRQNYSTFDFKKAYDSISHTQLKLAVKALPVHNEVTITIILSINVHEVIFASGKERTQPIRVKGGIYQGDSLSPLVFILVSECINEAVNTYEEIIHVLRGRQEIAVFMDDIKKNS